MRIFARACVLALAFVAVAVSAPRAATPEEWIALGTHIDGTFSAYIPVGIRIGLDALKHLGAEPRGVSVTFYSGGRAPCPCIADGIMLATQASPGQGTLVVSKELAPREYLAIAEFTDKKSRKTVKYLVADHWTQTIIEWNKQLDPIGRYKAAMDAKDLYQVMEVVNIALPPGVGNR